jgi:hypothetical protein
MSRRAAFLIALTGLTAAAPLGADRPAPVAVQAAAPAAARAAEAALSPEQIERFLATAEIKSGRLIGKGVTSPWRLTLSDGAITHDAAFQSINRERDNVRFKGGREEKLFRDYYGYNIAAYRLARALGYDDLVPVSVERTWKGKRGALTWWVNKKWDEDERLREKVEPPDRAAWERQIYLARVFTALVEDTDRNLGNQLVTEDFHLWMIDFTRAFRRSSAIDKPELLRKIDRRLYERMKALDTKAVGEAVKPFVDREELAALCTRLRAIVSHYAKIADERGEQVVFY